MITRLLRTVALLILVLNVQGAFGATTHYISKSLGADTNNGTSKTTPWAHLRGMPSCASNCASYTPVAGDQFILMGCDVWVPSDFFVAWDWSGTSSSPIYIGVDHTWYNTTNCPSSWNRPVFDCQNTCSNEMFRASADNATSWVTVDWIEMRRAGSCLNFDAFNATSNWTLSNLYIHAWHQVTDTNGAVVQFQSGNTFTTGVIDGSDSTPTPSVTCNYFYSTPPNVTNSVLHDMPNGIVGYAGGGSGVTTVTWSGNDIYNINTSNGGSHGNAIETVSGGTYYIHDNRIHHMGGCSGCESMFIGNSGETDYVWNNLIYDLGTLGVSNSQTPSIGGETGGHTYFYNDTIVAVDNQSCINNGGQGAVGANVTVQNIHCIQGTSGGAVSDFTLTSPNLLQTATQAAANTSPHFDQYTASETYPISPLVSTNSTVGAGANQASNCTGSVSGLCGDIAYYVQTTINGVVQAVPGRTVNTRPASGAWDVGAYQFSSSTAQALQPPTSLQASVQ
jgi:hypothetical protein